jgi:hypothetical protein
MAQDLARKMFMPHALSLKEKGFKSILMDLPGHGSRLTEALTLENSIKGHKRSFGVVCNKKRHYYWRFVRRVYPHVGFRCRP